MPATATFTGWPGYLITAALAVGLSWIFWSPLWEGGSLIGGDLFPYFFPQKVFLADQLRAGVIPLWNPLTGHGYPTIAESQTGVCYPPDLVAYRCLPVTMAYNVVQIGHYIFAFAGTWRLARQLGCLHGGALLAALSFVYGWFPPRICLEWAIVSGAYLPWALWCAESYLQFRRGRFLAGLCLLLTLQLLAGHFHLAFLTQLTLMIYTPLRWMILKGRETAGAETSSHALLQSSGRATLDRPESIEARRPWWLAIWGAMAVSFLLAAVQLVPTWELKQRSQRSEITREHQPGYGHMPPEYWSQVIVPWLWYPYEVDKLLEKLPDRAGGAGTNKVEAHLYFGSLPLMLALGGVIASLRRRSEQDRQLWLWGLIGLVFLLYTPGWFLPVTQYLPGFNFFRGPGRYGIITSMSIALMAGITFSRLSEWLAVRWRTLLALVVLTVTAVELWWVALYVGYSTFRDPVVELRIDSPLRRHFAQEPQPARLFAPMANVANLLDVSALPVYLGIGPQEYFDPQFTMPTGPRGGLDPAGRPDQIAWLREAGVTHILTEDRLPKTWPVDFLWSGFDPVFNRALGRPPEQPLYLYRLHHSRGRIAWDDSPDEDAKVEISSYAPHQVAAQCHSAVGGRIVLTDLAYPGWQVEIDGQPAPPETSGMFRAVTVGPGSHQIVWTYRPRSVSWGVFVSAATFVSILIAGLILHRRPARLRTDS